MSDASPPSSGSAIRQVERKPTIGCAGSPITTTALICTYRNVSCQKLSSKAETANIQIAINGPRNME
ncbi:hypothetical protein X975_12484, partial [Stegodyphus mimosarum]